MNPENAIKHIVNITDNDLSRYRHYLRHIAPANKEDIFRRWLFSYASVHTQWVMNCRLYNALQDLKWLGDKKELGRRIKESRAGMHNKRTDFIYEFSQFYWDHPAWFRKNKFESWPAYRDRLEKAAKGIGIAKAAFVVEMTYPITSDVICVDTHIFQLYGYTAKGVYNGVSRKKTEAIEEHWTRSCRACRIPPVLARWLYWDAKQGYSNSRYWSFMFEKENYHARLDEIARVAQRQTPVGGYRVEPAARNNSAVSIVYETVSDASLRRSA